jgi:hypothetical protein
MNEYDVYRRRSRGPVSSLVLARAQRRVAVMDAGEPRNAPPWLTATLCVGVVPRTFILATVAVPIVIYGLMPHLHRLRARLLARP